MINVYIGIEIDGTWMFYFCLFNCWLFMDCNMVNHMFFLLQFGRIGLNFFQPPKANPNLLDLGNLTQCQYTEEPLFEVSIVFGNGLPTKICQFVGNANLPVSFPVDLSISFVVGVEEDMISPSKMSICHPVWFHGWSHETWSTRGPINLDKTTFVFVGKFIACAYEMHHGGGMLLREEILHHLGWKKTLQMMGQTTNRLVQDFFPQQWYSPWHAFWVCKKTVPTYLLAGHGVPWYFEGKNVNRIVFAQHDEPKRFSTSELGEVLSYEEGTMIGI